MLLCGNLDLKEIDIPRCSLVFFFCLFFLFCRLAVCVFDILVVPGLP